MTFFDDPRAAWGAAANTNPTPVAPSARLGISWHYPGGTNTITPASDHQRCLNQVLAWQRFHMAAPPTGRGWADIGYNGLICMHGRAIEGRAIDLKGAHSPGVNFEHYGIQFMVSGNELPTPAMLARAVVLRAALEAHSGHTLRQWGHKDDPVASTDCPGPAIEAWVHSGGPYKAATAPTPTPTPGGLTMADINTLTAQLDALTSAVNSLASAEADRYKVYTGRYQEQATGLSAISAAVAGVSAKVVPPADPAAIAAALEPILNAAIAAVVTSGVPVEGIAQAVVNEFAARITPPPAAPVVAA